MIGEEAGYGMACTLDRVIDAHVHFWSPDNLVWFPHLAPDFDTTLLGLPANTDIRRPYDAVMHKIDTAGLNVVGTVHVNAVRRPEHFLDEILALTESRRQSGIPAAIVAKVDPTWSLAEARRYLDAYAEFPELRGLRILHLDDWTTSTIAAVLEWLVERDHVLDLAVHPSGMRRAADAIRAISGLRVVVEHAGWPERADITAPDAWRAGLREFAELGDRITAKLSGLSMALRCVDPVAWHPWVAELVAAFGSERLMWASNFPVDGVVTGYAATLRCYVKTLELCGTPDFDSIFFGTAVDVYGLSGLAPAPTTPRAAKLAVRA